MTQIRVFRDPGELAHAVAAAFVDLVAEHPEEVGFSVALTGGTIADRIHTEIARLGRDRDIEWGWAIEVWWGDERFVPAGSPDRNAGQARAAFLGPLGVGEGHIFEVPALSDGATGPAGAVGDVRRAAEVYADLLRFELHHGAFDLVMLGVGPDGHVASLFPGRPELDVTGVDTVAVTGSPKPPPERVSLTFDALNRTDRVWFLVSGEEKAEAVARALAEDGSVAETPARGISAPQVVWWLDQAAASLLP